MDAKTNSTILEVKEINSRYTTDVIAITAYGIQANSLNDSNGIFRKSGRNIFTFTWLRSLEFKAIFFIPILVKIFRFKVFPKQTTIFLRDTINHVIEERMRTGIVRNDLIDILIKFKQEAEKELSEGKKPFILERDALAAQAAIFFSAGFETSSSTMSFAMFQMAHNLDMQRRVREELREAYTNNNGKITYELILGLKYMENVLNEVLRLYPPLPFLDRECTPQADEKGYSLKAFGMDFTIPPNMPVFIPDHAIHMDPKVSFSNTFCNF